MLLTKQSVLMNDLLWKPVRNISSITLVRCYSNFSLHRLMSSRQHFLHLSSPFCWNGKELGFSQNSSFQHLLMQFCSFSPLVLLCARMTSECKKKNKSSLQLQSQEPTGSVKRAREDSESEVLSQVEDAGQMQKVSFMKAKCPKIDLKSSEKNLEDDENILLKYQRVQNESSDSDDSDSQDSTDEDSFDFVKKAEMVRNIVQQVRKWCYTEFGQRYFQKTCRGLDFTLMSYNILSQQLLEDNLSLYRHCHYSKVLDWDYRKLNLLKEIHEADPDIICLQELQEFHYNNEFQPELKKLGYHSLYKKKTGGKSDGCAIFYKSCLFRLESYKEVDFYKNDSQILNRDNIGLIAVLKPKCIQKELDMKLCIATTHLLFNPKRGDVKLAQLRVLLAEIDKLAFRYLSKNCHPAYHPVILCGDMNSEPFSPLYNFITHGSLECADLFCGEVSGQKEGGYKKGKMIPLDELLNPSLNINRHSQYHDIGIQRYQDWIEQYGPSVCTRTISNVPQKDYSSALFEKDLPSSNSLEKEIKICSTATNSEQFYLNSLKDKSGAFLMNFPYSKSKDVKNSLSDIYEPSSSTSDSKIFYSDSHKVNPPSMYDIPSTSDSKIFYSGSHKINPPSVYYIPSLESNSENVGKYSPDIYEVFPSKEPSEHLDIHDVNTRCMLPTHPPRNESYEMKESTSCFISPQVQNIMSDLTSGCINHNFKFVSTYAHNRSDNQPEVTTHHMKASCTVDYIFYSAKYRRRDKKMKTPKGPLRLIGYFNLMSDNEVQSVGGLPNAFQSSDHLSLMARFFLKIP